MTAILRSMIRPQSVILLLPCWMLMWPAHVRGGLIFYTTQSSFNAAAPGLPVDTFSSAVTYGPNDYGTHASPISSATNDASIPAGTVLPGLSITTLNPGQASTALEIQGSGSDRKAIGTNWFQDTLVMNFAPGVSAVGENVFGNIYPGQNFAGTVNEQVYSGATLLGSTTLTEAAGPGGYLGVTSSSPNITSVELLFNPSIDTDSNTYVSNVSFNSVPEPASAALLAGSALLTLRRPSRQRSAGRRSAE